VRSRESLYELAASVAWEDVIGDGQTFAVEVVGRHRAFRNTTFGAQVVKDAAVDRLRSIRGRRPNVDRDQPDIRLHLRLVEKGASIISLDSSGEPLSHRGYRPRGGPAPLAETLAAGILLLADYDGSQPLLDPMCGTGTFAVEAALIATETPPGLHREFAFERWSVHDQLAFGEVQHEASHGHREAQQPIIARDRAERSVRATQRNLKAAWMDRWVEVEQRDALDLMLPWGSGGTIVANPPYGKRVGEVERLFGLYRRFGDSLKKQATGATAWVLAGEPRLAKAIGLRPSRRIPLYNGPIECRLLKFEMYEGSKKKNRPAGA
jgi:putative N6-adenine-specific DNA methylase